MQCLSTCAIKCLFTSYELSHFCQMRKKIRHRLLRFDPYGSISEIKKNGSTFHIPASSPWGQPWPWQLAVKHLLPRSARLGRRGRGLRRDRLPEDSVDDVGAVSRKLDEEESTSGVSAAAAASTILRRRRKETLGWSGSTSGCLQILRLSGGISTLEMRFWAT